MESAVEDRPLLDEADRSHRPARDERPAADQPGRLSDQVQLREEEAADQEATRATGEAEDGHAQEEVDVGRQARKTEGQVR